MFFIRIIRDMSEGDKTWLKIVEGDSKHFSVEIRLHQRLSLGPFLFVMVMDKLAWSIQDEVFWYMLFVNDIVLMDDRHMHSLC